MSTWWKQHGCDKKSQLVDRIRALTAVAPRTLMPDEFNWVKPILERHYDFSAKGGYTATSINVVWTAPYGQKPTRCMVLVQPDGTEVDISWHVAISKTGRSSSLSSRRLAMRCTVAAQILDWSQNNPSEFAVCGFCHKEIGAHTAEVDHYPTPFSQLAAAFEGKYGTRDEVQDGDRIGEAFFADIDYGEQWARYHLEHASYRWAHKKCNNSRKAVDQ